MCSTAIHCTNTIGSMHHTLMAGPLDFSTEICWMGGCVSMKFKESNIRPPTS